MQRLVRIATLVALSLSNATCAWEELDAAQAARDEYGSCRRDHAPTTDEDCQAARERYEADYRRYEEAGLRECYEGDKVVECPQDDR
jgi:hypothetical protein